MNNEELILLVKKLKELESDLDKIDWNNEDKVLEYNETVDNILKLLKEIK